MADHFQLCGVVHEDHDPYGHEGAGGARRQRLRAMHPLGWSAASRQT